MHVDDDVKNDDDVYDDDDDCFVLFGQPNYVIHD